MHPNKREVINPLSVREKINFEAHNPYLMNFYLYCKHTHTHSPFRYPVWFIYLFMNNEKKPRTLHWQCPARFFWLLLLLSTGSEIKILLSNEITTWIIFLPHPHPTQASKLCAFFSPPVQLLSRSHEICTQIYSVFIPLFFFSRHIHIKSDSINRKFSVRYRTLCIHCALCNCA